MSGTMNRTMSVTVSGKTLSGRASSVALAVATVLTTVLTIWLVLGLYDQHDRAQRRQDILAAARQSALNFTSLDYRHYDRDSANVLQGATGDFKKQFAAQTEQLTKLVAANESVSEGQILDAGIVRSDEHSARVLVVVFATVLLLRSSWVLWRGGRSQPTNSTSEVSQRPFRRTRSSCRR